MDAPCTSHTMPTALVNLLTSLGEARSIEDGTPTAASGTHLCTLQWALRCVEQRGGDAVHMRCV